MRWSVLASGYASHKDVDGREIIAQRHTLHAHGLAAPRTEATGFGGPRGLP